MGQAQSEATGVTTVDDHQSQLHNSAEDSSSSSSSTSTSMESLIAEAVAYGNSENESLDAKAKKALECPCIAELRNGQCGVQFSEAFVCFLKSTAEEKGSDCVHPFVALQDCIKANPNAFSKDVLEEEEEVIITKEDETAEEYVIKPPAWSQPRNQRSKL